MVDGESSEGEDAEHGGGALKRCWSARWEKGALGLLSGRGGMYQGSLAEARQPFAMIRSPVGAGALRSMVESLLVNGVV